MNPTKSQSLWNRAMSFDRVSTKEPGKNARLNPFGTGQCLSTNVNIRNASDISVSIPLEQGNVFRRIVLPHLLYALNVSIPLEQGNVFRHNIYTFF